MSAHPPPQRVPDVSPDLPSLPWRLTLRMLRHLPQAALSRGLGALADTPIPRPLRKALIGGFARMTGIDVAEAEQPVAEYPSINAFFVRRLRPGARVWPGPANSIASPVDGIVGQHGSIRDGRLVQAKGRHYSAADLLGDARRAVPYAGGTFVTIYLSPRHYHRIHAPCDGAIHSALYIPGALLPVNEAAVLHVPDLFPRNERVICEITGDSGRVAIIAIGAYNVGRISTAFDTGWVGAGRSVANRRRGRPATRSYDPPVRVARGDEIMAFHLGSTIVLLCEPGPRNDTPPPGTEIRLGEILLSAPLRSD